MIFPMGLEAQRFRVEAFGAPFRRVSAAEIAPVRIEEAALSPAAQTKGRPEGGPDRLASPACQKATARGVAGLAVAREAERGEAETEHGPGRGLRRGQREDAIAVAAVIAVVERRACLGRILAAMK